MRGRSLFPSPWMFHILCAFSYVLRVRVAPTSVVRVPVRVLQTAWKTNWHWWALALLVVLVWYCSMTLKSWLLPFSKVVVLLFLLPSINALLPCVCFSAAPFAFYARVSCWCLALVHFLREPLCFIGHHLICSLSLLLRFRCCVSRVKKSVRGKSA